MSVALLPTSCRSFCSFSSDLLKNKQKHASGNGKGMKRQDGRPPAFPKDNPPLFIFMSRACLANHFGAAEALPIQLFHQAWTEVSPQGPSGFDFNHQKKFYVHSTWVQCFGTRDHTDLTSRNLRRIIWKYFMAPSHAFSYHPVCWLQAREPVDCHSLTKFQSSEKNFKASRFVSSLACCLSAWKSLPGSEMSDLLQSGAKIWNFRKASISRAFRCTSSWKTHAVTHWKNRRVFISNCGNCSECSAKIAAPKKKNAISSPLACHLDPFVKL